MRKAQKWSVSKMSKVLAKYCQSMGWSDDDVEAYPDTETAESYIWNLESHGKKFKIVTCFKTGKITIHD